ncbi:MAG: RpoL/Rpb11 RNA polymerase subunit family protein [Thermoplasmatota archaeon]
MEFEVLERTEDKLEIKVIDADETLMYPLIEQLLQDESVNDATYSVEHQELDDPILKIEVKEGEDPKEILLNVTRDFKQIFEDVYEDLFGEEEE